MNRIDIGLNIIVQGQMIKALLLVSEKKNFKVFLLKFQTCDHPGGAEFDPRGIICTTLLEMLHMKYQSSAPSSFRVETHPPPPPNGAGPVLTQGESYEQSW